jgi:hypothetical protein
VKKERMLVSKKVDELDGEKVESLAEMKVLK